MMEIKAQFECEQIMEVKINIQQNHEQLKLENLKK